MCSQTEGDMGRQSVQVKCVHRGGCSQWALRATDDLGTRTRTLRGQNGAPVLGLFHGGAPFQLGRRSKSLFRGVPTHLPAAVRGDAVGQRVVAGGHWALLSVVFSDPPHFSSRNSIEAAETKGQLVVSRFSMQTQNTFILMRSLSEEKKQEYIQAGKGLVFSFLLF